MTRDLVVEDILRDLDLESKIAFWSARLGDANATEDERRMAWDSLKALHGQRSLERVAEMEVSQGLR